MSECQYYEFKAIDRPLSAEEMAELRSCSTRARITRMSFVNDYSWGSFKGDADAWMERLRALDARGLLRRWRHELLIRPDTEPAPDGGRSDARMIPLLDHLGR